MTSKLDRRKFLSLSGAAVGALAAGVESKGESAEQVQDFSFIFFTDTHTQPELNATEGTSMAFRRARTLKADFAIGGGDLVFDVSAVPRERVLSLYDMYAKAEQDLGLKIYHTIGNHDVVGAGADLISQSDPIYGKRLWNQKFGETYYSFDHKGYHFVVLDSIEYQPDHSFIGRIDAGQMEWLAKDLSAQPKGTPVIVVAHMPLASSAFSYDGPEMYKKASMVIVTNARDVISLLDEYNVIAVLQGHTHINEQVVWKGKTFLTSGAVCGNWWRGSRLGIPEGFTVVHLHNGRFSTEYVTYGFKSADPTAGPGFK
jgi:3',5'-cyclic AMP phosphodiesterase CpdA